MYCGLYNQYESFLNRLRSKRSKEKVYRKGELGRSGEETI
jgi:hypothetical protein